jgi:putative ABC transport system permease protein
MNLKKSFKLAFNLLVHSKLRSWLTIIGIIIGIAAIVSIVSISQGAEQQLEERLGSLGADIITISPGVSRARGPPGFGGGGGVSAANGKNLTDKDIMALKLIPNVGYVMGYVSDNGDMAYSSKTASLSIRGVDPAVWEEITEEELEEGRFLIESDAFSVVLGSNIVDTVFDKEIPLNSKVTIEGKTFNVVGILDGGSTAYMPADIARSILDDVGDEEYSSIAVKIQDIELAEETVDAITDKLMLSRGILTEKDKDFSVSSPTTMQETMQETMQVMGLFLGAIAAISLLVGAIGITNTMFTSVLEKTKEIGIMKAIGAKRRDIMLIFILNSGMIGFVGGLGGIILGVIGSGFIGYLSNEVGGGGMQMMFGSTAVTPELLIFALVFSVILGILAGVIPAYRASKLDPVDALRYE